MKTLIQALALTGVLAMPAFAQDTGMDTETMSCAQFTAMDSSGRMAAVEAMHSASMDSDMASGDMASGEAMASGDAMASDDAMASEDAMSSEDSMMADDEVAEILEACEGNDDMMAMDVMMDAMVN